MTKKKSAKTLKMKASDPSPQKLNDKRAPKLKIEDGKLRPPEDKSDFHRGLVASTGMADTGAAMVLMIDAFKVGGFTQDGLFKDETLVNSILALMHDINPQNAIEGMLTSQIIATYRASMRMLKNSMLPEQTVFGVDANINRATKLQRTFLQQIEALQKLRGKGQQKMTVEHVHVHEGGQAVVGNVNQGGGK